jgi:GT2 family glycosyltransferase
MNNPLVSIIVTTYKPSSRAYLDNCIQSIKNLDYDNYEVILVSHKDYQPQYPDVKTVAPPGKDHFYPAEGINYAMKISDPKSKHFFILNDDVICTKNSLKNIVDAVADQNLMANSISPCENGQHYHFVFGYQKGDHFRIIDKRQYRLEEHADGVNEMMNQDSLYPLGIVWMNYLCIFATLIPRKIYDAVGDWDEKFKCGQDDLDYSWRAQKAGFQTVAVTNSLVWHFSGVTADSTLNLKIRQDNVRYFRDKWGQLPPGIPAAFLGE